MRFYSQYYSFSIFGFILCNGLQPLYLSTIFESLILALILISVVSCVENYSYRLLINKTNYDFNKIIVSKENLHFAKTFLSKFPASIILKTKVKQGF